MRYAALPLTLVALCALASTASRAQDKKAPPDEMTADEKKMFELINKERVKENLPPLTFNAKLQRAARGHSENMAKQDKLEHVLDGKTPGNRADAAGYNYGRLGENIAFNEGGTAAEVVKGWMESPAHRSNILKKEFKESGLAIAVNPKGVQYITQVFAAPGR